MSKSVTMKAALMLCALFTVSAAAQSPGKGRILICADKVTHSVSPLTTGACLEDVNHEVYGGLYSQMIYGESFEEPAPSLPIEGFIYEGPRADFSSKMLPWIIHDGVLTGPAGEGPKLLAKDSKLSEGRVDVEMYFDNRSNGAAGLIAAVSNSGPGADNFNGYEISLDPERNQIIFGKHQHDWRPIDRIDCSINVSAWISLSVVIDQERLQVFVDGRKYIDYKDSDPLPAGWIGLRTWQREARYRNLQITTAAGMKKIPFQYGSDSVQTDSISKMWAGVRKGDAIGSYAIETNSPFNGLQDQRITYESGKGRIGIANSGLNRRGMYFQKDKGYEGVLWARADKPVSLHLSFENQDGEKIYGQTTVSVTDSTWQRIEFAVMSSGDDKNGRFCLSLTEPGSVVVGYAFLQPGEWGRFKGLPVRLDVAEGLMRQKLTVIRYGGCMANAAEYRWKKMVGPRDLRPPYKGWWYPYSSNGWGIIDFIEFCEAAGFECVPDFNIEETPEDMADFVDYVHGGTDTVWGQKRAEAGHPEPYKLKYIQIGNEEKVNDHYLERFKVLAAALWSKNPEIILIVGDFNYNDHISDPYDFNGAPIRTLAPHREILRFAKENKKPVWFDVHIWNDEPRDPDRLDKGMGLRSFVNALEKLADGAEFKVCVFEENANNHQLRRGLGHAHIINEIQRYEHEMPILCAANCLQPDGQNDNGWDQGLLFLNQANVWGQSSYYVTQMISDSYQPLCVESYADSYVNALDVTACKSQDGQTLSVRVVNLDRWDVETEIRLTGYTPSEASAEVIQIRGRPEDVNTADKPTNIIPAKSTIASKGGNFIFPAYSFTVINFR
jgi:hypothetical protein